jgi:hypothetical protein
LLEEGKRQPDLRGLPAGNEDKIREVEFDIEDIDAAVRAALCC